MYEIRNYVTPSGKDVYQEWRKRLRDHKPAQAMDRRLARLVFGNFGDHKFLRDGVYELRLDTGQGYRIYYAVDGERIVILLCAGDKSTQRSDIERACAYWQDWQNSSEETDGEI